MGPGTLQTLYPSCPICHCSVSGNALDGRRKVLMVATMAEEEKQSCTCQDAHCRILMW